MDFDRGQVVISFVAESEEGLQVMEQSLIALEADSSDSELLDTIFRVAHTIKGNASALDFPELAGFAHRVEDLLDLLRNRELPINSQIISWILKAVDALRLLVPAAANGNDQLSPSHLKLIDNLRTITETQPVQTTAASGVNAAESQSAVPERPRRVAAKTKGSSLPAHSPTNLGAETDDKRLAAAAAVTLPKGTHTLRVDVAKLNQLLDLTGEMAVNQRVLREKLESAARVSDDSTSELLHEGERLLMELQELVLGVRMVSVGPVLRHLSRTVRDAASRCEKEADLGVLGEDVELDMALVDGIRDPLMHLVRNAVDHGLESPAERQAAGKFWRGRVRVSAAHEAGGLVIQVEDDGAGLNREAILLKAKSNKMITGEEQLTDEQVHELIFSPGFSTSSSVTEISGRGVGLDVVRKNVESLRGTVSIESRRGQGTTVTMRLPLTVSIIEGFSVGVGAETYLIPLDQVTECIDLPVGEYKGDEDRGVITLRGEPLPFFRIGKHFNIGDAPAERQSVVVVRHESRLVGLAVDALYGQIQTVIKPMSKIFQNIQGISGSTVLGNGRVALILDVPSVLRAFAAQ